MEDGMSEEAGELRELSDEEAETVSGGIIIVSGLESISWVMLNPQPLPPRELFTSFQSNMLG
jgi:hypothetical protein